MVNASLNWASIVGIVLAVSGAGLYFLRSFKPALARDYDVFFAAIGLLCGGILFFQGWRLDPILQFGQFLLAGTTVFFAYESVRLRGVTTDQARRSSYFDEELEPPSRSGGSFRDSRDAEFDQFDQFQTPVRRRVSGRSLNDFDALEDDEYQPRRSPRPAIPEEAASRRGRFQREGSGEEKSIQARRNARFRSTDDEVDRSSSFGNRRNFRQEQRMGSRPTSRRQSEEKRSVSRSEGTQSSPRIRTNSNTTDSSRRYRPPQGNPLADQAEDASYTQRGRGNAVNESDSGSNPSLDYVNRRQTKRSQRPVRSSRNEKSSRDNNSRFDD